MEFATQCFVVLALFIWGMGILIGYLGQGFKGFVTGALLPVLIPILIIGIFFGRFDDVIVNRV